MHSFFLCCSVCLRIQKKFIFTSIFEYHESIQTELGMEQLFVKLFCPKALILRNALNFRQSNIPFNVNRVLSYFFD